MILPRTIVKKALKTNLAGIDELKKLASRKIKIGQDIGIDEAQRFMNAHNLTKGTTSIIFTYVYYKYVEWRKSDGKRYISRRHFGKQIRRYLNPGKTRIGSTNYVTYKLEGMDRPQDLTLAWKQLWYEQQKTPSKKKKTRRP